MSLPERWVDKIFDKLSLVYGHQFLSRWDGLPLDTVKADWAHELTRFQQNPDAIAYGLMNLPAGQAPTVIEFRAICNRRPEAPTLALPSVPADPQRVAAEVAKLGNLQLRGDPKEWARRLIDRHAAGERIRPISLRFAREALGVRA